VVLQPDRRRRDHSVAERRVAGALRERGDIGRQVVPRREAVADEEHVQRPRRKHPYVYVGDLARGLDVYKLDDPELLLKLKLKVRPLTGK
jgi:hypothetical protein